MTYLSFRPILIVALAALLLTAAGCSRITVAYNTADFFVERYAKDYLGLTSSQISSWHPELERTLARHRREDLPYLARFFDTAHKGATKGFDRQRMGCLIDQFEGLYQRHMSAAVDLAAPLLAGLNSNQIRTLERKFRKEKADDKADMDPGGAAKRDRKRTKRYQKSIAWWTGPLSSKQKSIVSKQAAAIPDTAAAWLSYRTAKRSELIKMLRGDKSEKQIHRFLDAWLVHHRDLPASLRRARGQIQERITELFLRLDASFSSRQRTHFADRLATLKKDLLSLQRRPRMAAVKCAR